MAISSMCGNDTQPPEFLISNIHNVENNDLRFNVFAQWNQNVLQTMKSWNYDELGLIRFDLLMKN